MLFSLLPPSVLIGIKSKAGRNTKSTINAIEKISEQNSPKLIFGIKSEKTNIPNPTVKMTVVKINAGPV